MSRKSKGINAERDLIHKFWSENWASVRIAGSGSMRYPSADIIATNKLRILAVECKTCGENNKYLTKEELDQLKTFAELFNAEPWIAVRFDREEWYFLKEENLESSGTNMVVSLDIAKNKGLPFKELIK